MQLFEFAIEMLGKHRAFFPFAFIISSAGQLEAFADAETESKASAKAMYTRLVGALAALGHEGRIRAAAVGTDVKIGGPDGAASAIRTLCEHTKGVVGELVVPYRNRWLRGQKFGTPEFRDAPSEICRRTT